MEEATRGTLAAIAGQLAAIVGVLHLGLGVYYVAGGAGTAVAGDPRILLWVLAGAALVGGVAVATVGWDRRRLYGPGLAVVGLLVACHLVWPVLGDGPFYLGTVPVTAGTNLVEYAGAQLFGVRPVVKVVLVTELALALVLLALRRDGTPG